MVSNRLKRYSSLCLLMTCFFNNYYIIKNYDRKCSSKILFSNSSLQNKIKCCIECPSGPYNHKKTVHKYFLRSFFVWCVVFSFLFIVQIWKESINLECLFFPSGNFIRESKAVLPLWHHESFSNITWHCASETVFSQYSICQ